MRNYRKTRKHGGFDYIANVYVCGTKKDKRNRTIKVAQKECITNFSTANGFTVVETADDGNCFYDTLSKFGSRSGNPILNKTHLELRRQIIGEMLKPARRAELTPFFVPNDPDANALSNAEISAELNKFLRPYQWAGWMGDVIPQIAADILNINIIIYDVLNGNPSNHIDRVAFSGGAGAVVNVNMLRTNGSHFRLLWPDAGLPGYGPVLPRGKKTPHSRKVQPKNAVNETIAKLSQLKMNNSTTTGRVTRSKTRVASPTKRSASLERNLLRIANMEAKEAARAAEMANKAAKEAKSAAKKAELATNKARSLKPTNKKLNNNFFEAWENASFF